VVLDRHARESGAVLAVAKGVVPVPVGVDEIANGQRCEPPDLGDCLSRRRQGIAGIDDEDAIIANDDQRVAVEYAVANQAR
jgi:hypothetical protein